MNLGNFMSRLLHAGMGLASFLLTSMNLWYLVVSIGGLMLDETMKFRLSKDLLQFLEKVAKQEGRSVADVIRRILEGARDVAE
jgi:hypothetical protein